MTLRLGRKIDQTTIDAFSLHTLAFVCDWTHDDDDDVPTHSWRATALKRENNLEPWKV